MNNLKKNGLLLNGLSVTDYFKIISEFFKKGCLIADSLESVSGWNNYWNDIYKENKNAYEFITSSNIHPPYCEPVFNIKEIKLPTNSIYEITPRNEAAQWEVAGLICSGNSYQFILTEDFPFNEKIKNLINFYFENHLNDKSIRAIDTLVEKSNILIFSELFSKETIERFAYIENQSQRTRFINAIKKSSNKDIKINELPQKEVLSQ